MKSIEQLTKPELLELIKGTPASTPAESNYREQLTHALEDDFFHNSREALRNIQDECHDGAFTEDETSKPFDEDDIETYNYSLQTALNS